MLMQPLPLPDSRLRLTPRRPGRRRILQVMLTGSVLLHLLALLALWLARPAPPDEDRAESSAEVAMVFDSAGAQPPSQASPSATQVSAAPSGNATATTTQPDPDTTPPSAPPPSAPPAPDQATPAEPPAPEPPPVAPPQPAADPAPPPAAAPSPVPPPAVPPTVTLSEEPSPSPTAPPLTASQIPPPLPPLAFTVPQRPAPAPPRRLARPAPSNPFGAPQQWSFDTGPSSRAPSRSSRGFDLSLKSDIGQEESTASYVAGARPSGDWIGALKRWVQARTYYPEAAAEQGQSGAVTVEVVIDRSGRVLSSTVVRATRSPFLNMGFLGEWRGATVPVFTPDMTEQTTTIDFTMNYILVGHR